MNEQQRKAMELALEALETLHDENMDYLVRNKLGGENNQCMIFARDVIKSIKRALAQLEQRSVSEHLEPVAYLVDGDLYFPQEIDWETLQEQGHTVAALYTSPPQRKPLTDEPNLFWNDNDPEMSYASIDEFLNDEWNNYCLEVGDIRSVQQSIRLPNIVVRVTSVSEDGDIEYAIEAAHGIKE